MIVYPCRRRGLRHQRRMERTNMKILNAAALTAVLLTAGSALAADDAATVDMTKLTCKQFSAYDKDNAGTIMMWLEGYYTGDDDDAVIDFGKMAGDMTKLLVYCEAHPDDDIITAADDVMDAD
jgi:acid stress chaperone HdeB